MADEATTLWVRSARTDDRVVLYERGDAHPNGEALVFSQTPVEVGDTALLQQRLHERQLVKVQAPAAQAASTAPDGEASLKALKAYPELAAAGFGDRAAIRTATDEQLLAVKGVGPETVTKIRETVA